MFLFKRSKPPTPNTIADLTCRLLGHITHDEKLKDVYLQQIEREIQQLDVADISMQQAKQRYLDSRCPLTTKIESQLRYLQANEEIKKKLLVAGWRIIWADKYLGLKEYQSIHLCGYWLGFTREAINALGNIYRPKYISPEHQKAMILLGVTEHSSSDAVKKAYKHLLSRHHPDKVIGEGGDADKVCEATVLTIKLNKAYALIQELHHFDK